MLFESEDPDRTSSGSETQEARPGWPPDDRCTDLTQYRGSFDDRDREGLRLLSPMLQQRVLRLQKDLEEAKAESRYFRANRSENPVVTPNRPRFTSTPVPQYAGGSEPTGPRGVFQVTHRVSDEHNETSTEPDPAPSEYEILAQRLREMALQPVPGNSDTIDIEQLLKLLLLVDTVDSRRRNLKKWTTEHRETSPDPGRGVSHLDQ